MFRKLSLAFSAGALGALANSVFLWALGVGGVTAIVGVGIAPDLTPGWLYPRLVWGGIWGFLLAAPVWRNHSWLRRGLLFSLGPTLVQLFVVFPVKTPHGIMGFGLGELTPLVVVATNVVWGLVAAFWYRRVAG